MLANTIIFPLLLSAPAPAPAPALVAAAAAVDQEPAVRISLDDHGDYYTGHGAQVAIKTDRDGYLLVLKADPAGGLRVLFPLEPYDDGFVEGGKSYEIVNRSGRAAFQVGYSSGVGTVFAAYSKWPFSVKGYASDRRWNYEALRIAPDAPVETALVDLVTDMAYDGWFEYDLAEYEVTTDDSYADDEVYSEGPRYRVQVSPYVVCCRPRFGLSIYWGSDPYYPYWNDPYYYGSFYYSSYGYSSYWYPSHHYYGPYYGYRPVYYGPVYPRHYYGGFYRPRYGYPYGRRYSFKRPGGSGGGRHLDPYRPRGGVGIDTRRGTLAGDAHRTGYRGRLAPTRGGTAVARGQGRGRGRRVSAPRSSSPALAPRRRGSTLASGHTAGRRSKIGPRRVTRSDGEARPSRRRVDAPGAASAGSRRRLGERGARSANGVSRRDGADRRKPRRVEGSTRSSGSRAAGRRASARRSAVTRGSRAQPRGGRVRREARGGSPVSSARRPGSAASRPARVTRPSGRRAARSSRPVAGRPSGASRSIRSPRGGRATRPGTSRATRPGNSRTFARSPARSRPSGAARGGGGRRGSVARAPSHSGGRRRP